MCHHKSADVVASGALDPAPFSHGVIPRIRILDECNRDLKSSMKRSTPVGLSLLLANKQLYHEVGEVFCRFNESGLGFAAAEAVVFLAALPRCAQNNLLNICLHIMLSCWQEERWSQCYWSNLVRNISKRIAPRDIMMFNRDFLE